MSYQKNLNLYQQKGMIFRQVESILQSVMVINFFLVFVPMLNSLTLDNSKKVTNWISIGASREKIKPFDTNFAPIMSNLASRRVNLKFNNSVLAQKKFFFIVQ